MSDGKARNGRVNAKKDKRRLDENCEVAITSVGPVGDLRRQMDALEREE